MIFPLHIGGELRLVRKLHPEEWTHGHTTVLRGLRFCGGQAALEEPGWGCPLLGSGEEKAVAVVCDDQGRVFAAKLIDEGHYQQGRFVGGTCYAELRAPALAAVPLNPHALVGLRFSGLVKAREFVYGYERDRFQLRAQRRSRFDRMLTGLLQTQLQGDFLRYQARYRDVHGRNVMSYGRGVHQAWRGW